MEKMLYGWSCTHTQIAGIVQQNWTDLNPFKTHHNKYTFIDFLCEIWFLNLITNLLNLSGFTFEQCQLKFM